MKIWESSQHPERCIIWMHGLGSSPENMLLLAKQLAIPGAVRHVSLRAPLRAISIHNGMEMPAWYDVKGFRLVDREDDTGILESKETVLNTLEAELAHFASEDIYLAGFSQGAAMALYAGLNVPMRLGGIMALSGYLPIVHACRAQLDRSTPIFIGYGMQDDIVLPAWTQKSVEWLKEKEYAAVTECTYNMQHSVCVEEIKDMSRWLMGGNK